MKNIHIPTIDELMSPDTPYGILFGSNNGGLHYYDLANKKEYLLCRHSNEYLISILATSDEVYYGGIDEKVRSLFGNIVLVRTEHIMSIKENKGTVLDGGLYGVWDTLKDKILISDSQLESKGNAHILSLMTDPQDNLYAFVSAENNSGNHNVIKINESQGTYKLGETILFNGTSGFVCQAVIIPHGSFKGVDGLEYPFSVISCANLHYLDINGVEINGTRTNNSAGLPENIHCVEILEQNGGFAEIIHNRESLKYCIKIKVDLDQKTVLKEEQFLNQKPTALHAVKNFSLHQKLIQGGRQ
jgi:hypothetical protein